jgi:hypothetical protein
MGQVFLVKENNKVLVFYSEAEMKAAGYIRADKVVTDEEFNGNGCYARIVDGEIIVGESEAVKSMREEVETLTCEESAMQSELDGKDYKVIKASETGQVLADIDPELHERREWCRNRINEIRARLAELSVGISAV